MSAVVSVSRGSAIGRVLNRNHGMIVAIATLILVFAGLEAKLTHSFGYYDFSSTASSAGALALSAIGETIVIILGGLDLSAGAVISLSNCLIVANMGTSVQSMILWAILGVLVGTVVGAVNGFFIVLLRLQPIVVTLATMFIVEGTTLLEMGQPGGSVPPGFATFFTGDAISNVLPAPVMVVCVALAIWGFIRLTPFGTFIYAVGSDIDSARFKGSPVSLTRFATYTLAGSFYGAAGVFLTAQTGSGDPTVGPPMLLPIFVAVVLGGTLLAGGRGGCIGTVFGALTLTLIVNLLLVFNVPTFYSTIVEGGLLILSVTASSLGRRAPVWKNLRFLRTAITARRNAQGIEAHTAAATAGRKWSSEAPRSDNSLPTASLARWWVQNATTIHFTFPAYLALAVILSITAIMFGHRISVGNYLDSLLVLTSFLAILALGQGAVIISGGLDLSVPSMITFAGVLLTGLTSTLHGGGLWSIILVLVMGAACGAINGLGIVFLGISPLIMTLAMNGILQGCALVYSGGTPAGTSPAIVSWIMTGKVAGLTPVVILLVLFVIGATVLLSRTTFGRRLYAVGNSRTVALFSGVFVGSILVKTYALSGLCAAVVGIMLVGFSGQAFNDMGDPYLLPAIAAVVIGGTLMSGGQGHYLGMFGGALLLTALTTVLTGLLLPDSMRSIVFGIAVLAAIISLREKSA